MMSVGMLNPEQKLQVNIVCTDIVLAVIRTRSSS